MAANSLVLGVEIIGEFKKLTAATQGSANDLSNLNKTVSNVSRKMRSALGAIGVGLSFAVLTRELKEATQAAVEDEKSQGLLANALRNTTNANDKQIAAVEKSITKMSLQSAVADDKLRPAFANLVRATGDVAKSTDLMRLALDVAAGTGKDVEAVSKAMAKAVGPDGTTGALERLVPAIKGASDPMAVLKDMFKGAADTAANLDPYAQMKVAFGEIQETVGMLLLPVLRDFADWLVMVAPDIQKFFTDLTDPTTPTGEAWANLGAAFQRFGDTLVGVFSDSGDSANTFIGVLKNLESMLITITDLVAGFKVVPTAFSKIFGGDFAGGVELLNMPTGDALKRITTLDKVVKNSGVGARTNNTITINNYQSNVTANDIVNKLNKSLKTNGSLNLGLK